MRGKKFIALSLLVALLSGVLYVPSLAYAQTSVDIQTRAQIEEQLKNTQLRLIIVLQELSQILRMQIIGVLKARIVDLQLQLIAKLQTQISLLQLELARRTAVQ